MEEYRLIIAGGRDFNNYDLLVDEVLELAGNIEGDLAIVSGMARGADALGVKLANVYGLPHYEFPADWNRHGKSAGYRRNVEMAKFADGLIAFWDGQSRGTKHMIEFMKSLDKPVHIVNY